MIAQPNKTEQLRVLLGTGGTGYDFEQSAKP